jgi:hypothetical protein
MTLDQKRRELITAIEAKQAVSFVYKSEQREGNPHTLGFLLTENPEDAEYSVRIYQTAGKSESQKIINPNKDKAGENFRLFHIKDLDKIEKLVDTFSPHPKFKSHDEMFDWKRKGVNRSIEVEDNG